MILLVEDNPDDELLTLRAFRKNNFAHQIQVVRDGEEALSYLFATGKYKDRDANDLPELILLDLNLPKISGLEVLRRIRNDQRTRLTPVVILTTSDEPNDRLKSYGLSANSFIRKPVDFDAFIDVIGQIGLYWLVLNVPPKTKG